MTDPELKSLAERLLAELQLKHPLKHPARIEWRAYRVTAGMAYYRLNLIGLSSLVLKTEHAVEDTLIHEYAHLLAFQQAGRRGGGHGAVWQQAMIELGRTPKVRHTYEVTRNTKRQEVGYQCLRCGETIVRSRRLPRRRKYVHAPCGGDLKLVFVRTRAIESITDLPITS